MTLSLNRLLPALTVAAATVAASPAFSAQPASNPAASPRQAPILGQSLRYCNPLSIRTVQPGSAQGVSLGDVSVLRHNGKYYMFCTGGSAWVSEDMVDWTYQRVAFSQGRSPVAPDIVKYNDHFYVCGNDTPPLRASDPLGPYEFIGNWTYEDGRPFSSFDPKIFVDDDNTPYLYYAGRSTSGIYGVPLDPENLSNFAATPTHLFAFDKSHIWERYGDMNEYSEVTWIEGPWIIKHNGTYYLQYSANGTQWVAYATGVYTSKSPLGPFEYAPNNPILRQTTGTVTGPAHGSVVEGPDGNLWQFYTIVQNNPPGGRRIGMDPVGFDEDGNMFVHGATSTPQWAPGIVPDPARNSDSGSIPLTVNKVRTMFGRSTSSSQEPGRDASYAVDNHVGTWWQPADGDTEPSLGMFLSPASEHDPVQDFTIDSCRIMFNPGGGGFGGFGFGMRGGARGGGAADPGPVAFQYKIEASSDGRNFTTVLDKTDNSITRYIEFDEIPPTACRFVRLTLTGWPGSANTPPGIIEFTVFGKPIEP